MVGYAGVDRENTYRKVASEKLTSAGRCFPQIDDSVVHAGGFWEPIPFLMKGAAFLLTIRTISMAGDSEYMLEPLREEADFTLYRGSATRHIGADGTGGTDFRSVPIGRVGF